MADTLPSSLDLIIVTPDRLVAKDAVDSVSIPGKNGYLGILPGHAPLLTELDIGKLTYSSGGRAQELVVTWGFAEVLPGRVLVLSNTAERPEDIDVERAERARQRAEEQLKQFSEPGSEMESAREALRRAIARLETAHHKTP
jgi:F-type H+-transporting ATPase subunit epsilon